MPQSEQVIAPELQAKIIEYLEKTENAVARAGDFVADQAPDVIQQWLAWEFWGSVFAGSSLLVAAIVSMVFGIRAIVSYCRTELHLEWWRRNDTLSVLGGVLVFVALCLAAPGLSAIFHAAKVSVAPKVVVIEKFADLIKDVKR